MEHLWLIPAAFLSGVAYFFWLAKEAFCIYILFPPAGILMAAGFLVAFLHIPSAADASLRRWLLAVGLPLLNPCAILLFGVLFVHPFRTPSSETRPFVWLINGFWFAHLPLAAVLAYKLKGIRLFTVSVSTMFFGYSCGAVFVSTMSVTGSWL